MDKSKENKIGLTIGIGLILFTILLVVSKLSGYFKGGWGIVALLPLGLFCSVFIIILVCIILVKIIFRLFKGDSIDKKGERER